MTNKQIVDKINTLLAASNIFEDHNGPWRTMTYRVSWEYCLEVAENYGTYENWLIDVEEFNTYY